jgi:RNA 2',3'-cyclic 3'-phosphodiesterase
MPGDYKTIFILKPSKMKRIFIAVKVEAGETLLRMISSLKTGLINESIKWTKPENIHITLAFLGDTEEEMIKIISEMLKEKCERSGKFELIIKGSGVFTKNSEPRVIWIGIEQSEKFSQLNGLIKSGLGEAGIGIEDRPFNPHLTLGRIKNIKDKEVLKSLLNGFQNKEIQKVAVNEVILYESILLPAGPVYKPIGKFKL